jgi:hypothetical protein
MGQCFVRIDRMHPPYLTEGLGADASTFEVQIILFAAAVGAFFVSSFIICPLKAVRV